jgi:hypothetical protein
MYINVLTDHSIVTSVKEVLKGIVILLNINVLMPDHSYVAIAAQHSKMRRVF